MQCDVAIFGGGVAGLWLLDVLVERGFQAVLLEAGSLGSGQTIASQGIIHGGLKYTLQGLLTPSAASIAAMPGLWRDCLQGRRTPDLRATRVRAEHCHLWRTDSFASRMGMIGARLGLRVAPQSVRAADRPAVLRHCPGDVARLDEQVISPASLLANLAARHRDQLMQIDERGLEFTVAAGEVRAIHLTQPTRAPSPPALGGRGAGVRGANDPVATDASARPSLALEPRMVVFTAGAGNAALRERVGLSAQSMQRRPLHMMLVRGELPVLNGHCVDGAKTRVTVTSDVDAAGRTVWQVGGQIAEDGVALDSVALIERCRGELEVAIPGLDLSAAEFAAYRVDRAEGVTSGGRRPDSFQVLREGNVVTAWPTKLVLAPVLADAIAETVAKQAPTPGSRLARLDDWPRPQIALPPWEAVAEWRRADQPARRAA